MDDTADRVSATTRLRIDNIVATTSLIALSTALFLVAPYNRQSLALLYGPPEIAITGDRFLVAVAAIYAVLCALYFGLERTPGVSKSVRFWYVLARFARAPVAAWRAGLTREDRLAVLSTLLKAFFIPIMVRGLLTASMAALTTGRDILGTDVVEIGLLALFDRWGYWFVFQTIVFVDLIVFIFGYMVETKRLGNEIRSVDPTLIGWAAALVCYPPFNHVTGQLLGSTVSEFPKFEDPTTHLALNVALLVLMALYASASVALGWKASNLTHRGIVCRGPYRVIRHPAYICKNLAWWIGSLPIIMVSFEHAFVDGLKAVGSIAAWSSVYALRALTEEDHLRSVDGEYEEYCRKVRYRFIPGVY